MQRDLFIGVQDNKVITIMAQRIDYLYDFAPSSFSTWSCGYSVMIHLILDAHEMKHISF